MTTETTQDESLAEFADQEITPNFDSSGEAYDRCNWDEHMITGRIFTVASEQIVGIAWAWPIAVTVKKGHLHAADSDPRSWTGRSREERIAAAVSDALALARSKGWALAAWA